ncbi:MAG: tetratricopeptide repeat protein [Acidobacteriota bacterium]
MNGPFRAAVALLALSWALAAPLAASVPESRTLPALEGLATPALGTMEPAVRDQLTERFAALDPPPLHGDPKSLAQAYGELGGLSFVYGLGEVGAVALRNARALDPESFRWAYLAGLTAQSTGRFEQAEEAYGAALTLQPNYPAALVRLGEALVDLGRPVEARRRFERALEVAPNLAAAHRGLGRAAAAEGDFEGAARHYERALEIQPAAAEVRFPLAQAYRQLGRAEEAKAQLALYDRQELIIPDPVVQEIRALAAGSAVHLMQGRRARARGDSETALAEFQKAVEADPDHPPSLHALASMLRQMGDAAGAAQTLRRAMKLQPGRATAHVDLAGILVLAEQPRDAEAEARRALEIEPDLAEGHLVLGIALARQQRHEDALEAFARALELDPLEPEPRFERAMSLLALRRGGQAVAALGSVLALDPEHPAALANLGVLLESSEPETARRHLEQALRLAPGPQLAARSHLSLGRIAERAGDFEQAAEHYASALGEDAAAVPAYLRLGSTRALAGDPEGAVTAYEDALKAAPGLAAPRLPLASAYLATGRPADARRALEAGLEQTPEDIGQTYLLGLLLSASGNATVRDPARGLELARRAFGETPSPLFGQGLAIALAAAGRFEEAVRAQRRLIAGLAGQAPPQALASARKRLAAFESGEPVTDPWREDRSLVPPPWLPLPGTRP